MILATWLSLYFLKSGMNWLAIGWQKFLDNVG
jgi:hypothetical protein